MQGAKIFSFILALGVAALGTSGQLSTIGCRKVLDLVLVVDGSDSISEPDFEKIKLSIASLVNKLDIESDQIWFGLVLYSSDITEVVRLQHDKLEIVQSISKLKHSRMGTNTALGIQTMNAILNSGRQDVPKMGVVITDGISLDTSETHDAAVNAINSGVSMYSAGIGSLVHSGELQGIATGPSYVLNFTDFDDLSLDFVDSAAAEICPMSECRGLLDMVVVVDGSDSISEKDFNTLKTAIVSLLDELTLGEDSVRFGLVLYSSNITTVLNLSRDKKHLAKEVAALTHSRQGTNTHLGIEQMNIMFAEQGRKGVPKVGIVITDGISKQPNLTAQEAATAKDNNINIYAVGVTKNIDITELKSIASSDEKAISIQTFDQLKEEIVPLMKQVCPTTTTMAPTTATTTMPTQTTHHPVVTPQPPVECITSGRQPGYPNSDEEAERHEIDDNIERDAESSESDDDNFYVNRQHINRQGLWNSLFGRHRSFGHYLAHDDEDSYRRRGYGLDRQAHFYHAYDDK